MGLSLLDQVVGCLLGATWATSMTFVVEMHLLYKYFTRFEDGWRVRTQVLSGTVLGLVLMINEFCSVYLYDISHWGDTEYLSKQSLTIPIYLLSTGLLALNTQLFLIHRLTLLLKNKVVRLAVWGTLGGAALASVGGALWTGVLVIMYPAYADRGRLSVPVTVWLSVSAAADVAIALTLVGLLLKIRKAHNASGPASNSSAVIARLVKTTVETGSFTALLALIAFVVFITDDTTNISVAVAYQMGRFYNLTILVALNMRESSKNGSNTLKPSQTNTVWSRARGDRRGLGAETYGMQGISVTHSVHVEEDNDIEHMSPIQEKSLERTAEKPSFHVKLSTHDPYSNLKEV